MSYAFGLRPSLKVRAVRAGNENQWHRSVIIEAPATKLCK